MKHKRHPLKNPVIPGCTAACIMRLAIFAALNCDTALAVETAPFYKEEQVFNLRPSPDREQYFGYIGVTGLKARVYKGVVVKVESVTPDTPAAGKFKAGDIISAVNGVALSGTNPFIMLGHALLRAEGTDGVLVFDVQKSEGGASQKVTISIPVTGKFNRSWPINCKKSAMIIEQAAGYYATDKEFRKQHLKGKGIGGALACLFLMSTGEDKYLPVVKEYFDNFPKKVESIGDHTWNNGYNGIACAEYYLRTGDNSVLPIIQYYCDNAKDRQVFDCSWTHWGYGVSPGYVASGLMNPAGAQILTTLLLGKECGVNVDQRTMLRSLRYWYRFAGHGTVPYGDHRPEGGLGSNGKDGMSAAIMQIASGASGDVSIYKEARDYLSMSTLTAYPVLAQGHGDEGRGDAMWRGNASVFALAEDPAVYHDSMNRILWWYALSRRPSGAFGVAGCSRFDDEGSGAGVAMTYTAPLKQLRITGAPRSKFARNFQLPEKLWGTDEDRKFLSTKHNPTYYKYGKDEPVHIPFYKYGSAYRKPDVDLKNAPTADILKNVCHKRYMIRTQAAKALVAKGAFQELELLLQDTDPRIRRAALDGMIDYRYWFGIGKSPIKKEQFSPAMVTAIKAMLSNPEEAWWVIDGALTALRFAPAGEVDDCLPLIKPWTTHEDWWLREAAFNAMLALQDDEKLLAKVLPTLNQMMVDEYHTMPRQRFNNELNQLLKKNKSTPAGRQILSAFLRAVKESEIKPDQGRQTRSSEGAHNVLTTAEICLREAPEHAIEVARIIKSRSTLIGTTQIMRLIATPNYSPESKPYGFCTLLEKLPAEQKKELTDILCKEYLPELKRRRKAESNNDQSLINTIIDLVKLSNPEAGWQPVGTPLPTERTWRFTSFDPPEEEKMHPREKKRFRNVSLPEGIEKWYMPEFDDSGWKTGKAPIGIGVHKRGGVSFRNNSEWGSGEFLLMRTEFEIEDLAYDSFRLSILAKQGFHVYLNGHKISSYVWWKDMPHYRFITLSENQVKLLKKGRNVLAAYGNVEYDKNTIKPSGQMDLLIEGLNTANLE